MLKHAHKVDSSKINHISGDEDTNTFELKSNGGSWNMVLKEKGKSATKLSNHYDHLQINFTNPY